MDKKIFEQTKIVKPLETVENTGFGIFAARYEFAPIHAHSGLEFIYVLEGSVQVKISFNSYELKKGDFLLINQLEVHNIEGIIEDIEPNLLLTLHVENNRFLDEQEIGDKLYAFDPQFYRTCNREAVKRSKELMKELYEEKKRSGRPDCVTETCKGADCHGKLEELLRICGDFFQIQQFDPVNRMESPLLASNVKLLRIKNIFQYLYHELDQKIQLSGIAKIEFIDRFYAARIIKEGTGSTFHKMLNIVRVDRSEVLLLGTDMTIDEIMRAVGFSSATYFSSQFKEYFLLSPGEYRKEFKPRSYPKALERIFPVSAYEDKNLFDQGVVQGALQMKEKILRQLRDYGASAELRGLVEEITWESTISHSEKAKI